MSDFKNFSRIMKCTITVSLIVGCLMYSGGGYAASTQKTKSSKSSKSNNKLKQKRLKTNPVTDEEEAWIANAETDIYRVGTFENLLVGYSTTNGWDFSLSLLNVQSLGPNKQFQGDTFFNIAKTFSINNRLSIVVGSQNGMAMVSQQPHLWFNFTYLDTRYDVTPWLSLHGGPILLMPH